MSSWAERVHRRAADLGSVVTSCGHPGPGPYPYRLEKVKFGVSLDEVCKNDIPGPLLVLILKLNKESPQRRDIFRAPGHQGAMKNLIHFLQAGRLVNVDKYSVYTIASVLKKFLRKIPNGIFGRAGEDELFAIYELDNEQEQQKRINRLITSLPTYTQHLLVLLFGTFRVIASNALHSGTGMTSEALGVSVAPSFFQTCVSDGKTARMEDVLKFKTATRIMKQMIDKFAKNDLFGRSNYEYYARVTGRILKVQDEWICSFQFPKPMIGKLAHQNYFGYPLEAEKTWLQCECERWGLIAQEESRSTPALLTSSSSAIENSAHSLGVPTEHSFIESCARLSVSLEGPGVFAKVTTTATTTSSSSSNAIDESAENHFNRIHIKKNNSDDDLTISTAPIIITTTAPRCSKIKHSSSCSSTRSSKSASGGSTHMTMDELRAVNRYAESTKSLSFLPQVHERQAARMRTRSEWFLGDRIGSLEFNSCGNYEQQFMGGSSNDIQELIHQNMTNEDMYIMLKSHQHQSNRHYEHQYCQLMDTDIPTDYNQKMNVGQYLTVSGHPYAGQSSQPSSAVTSTITSTTTTQPQPKMNLRTTSPLTSSTTQLSSTATATASSTSASASRTNQQNFSTSRMFLDTFQPISAGNIRLSNSAESIQYPIKRTSRRGLTNLTRHHPHRSSLRRNKDKVKISSNNNDNSSGSSGCSKCTETLSSSQQHLNHHRQSSSTRTVSFETENQLKTILTSLDGNQKEIIDKCCENINNMDMDIDTNVQELLPSTDTIMIFANPVQDDDLRKSPTVSTCLRFKPPRV